MNVNDLCYNYEKIRSTNSLFPIVECTYVLIMNSSKYEKRVREQLKKYPISSNILLQWNKGYKKCNKKLEDYYTSVDLTDATLTVLENAIRNNYNYICILEEDFIIRPEIVNHCQEINKFIEFNNTNLFLLGSILLCVDKKEGNFMKVSYKQGTHAIIINRETIHKYRKEILVNRLRDIDILTNKYIDNKYCYKKPLIIQVLDATENQSNWGKNEIKNPVLRILMLFIYNIILDFVGFKDSAKIIESYEKNNKMFYEENIISRLIGSGAKFINKYILD